MRKHLCMLVVAAALAGCASYNPPAPLSKIENQRTINANFDTTWSALIDYVSSTYFAISQFEKASGLLTLSFGESDIARFVDCGTWNGSPYASRTGLGFRLTGRMNLRVRAVDAGRTNVRISTRYVLRTEAGNTYTFGTDGRATVEVRNRARGTPPTRTCQSTHAAEKQILTGIAAISSP